MAELLHMIVLDCTGVTNKLASERINAMQTAVAEFVLQLCVQKNCTALLCTELYTFALQHFPVPIFTVILILIIHFTLVLSLQSKRTVVQLTML